MIWYNEQVRRETSDSRPEVLCVILPITRAFRNVPKSSQSDMGMSGLTAATAFIIHAEHLREGGIPRWHILRISSRSWQEEIIPDLRVGRADQPEASGIVWSIDVPRRVSIEEQKRSRGFISARSSCVSESILTWDGSVGRRWKVKVRDG